MFWDTAGFVFLYVMIDAVTNLRTHVYRDYMAVTLPQLDNYTSYVLNYKIQGTHVTRIIEINDGQRHVNITNDSPGSLVEIKLIKHHRKDAAKIVGTSFARMWCGEHFILSIGSPISILSPGYPDDILPWVVCSWSFQSTSNVTWYRINGSFTESYHECVPFLLINNEERCWNTSVILYNSTLSLSHHSRQASVIPYTITVEAIPALLPPYNVSAVSFNNTLEVSWILQDDPIFNHSIVLTYMLYQKHSSSTQLRLDPYTTSYVINTTGYEGRLYMISVYISSDYGNSLISDTFRIRADCKINVSLNRGESIRINSRIHHVDTLCRWHVTTVSSFQWIKFDISRGQCNDSFLKVENRMITCLAPSSENWVEETSLVEFVYKTGQVKNKSMKINVTSVDVPTTPPYDVIVSSLSSKITVAWQPPRNRADVITRYIVHYSVNPYHDVFTLSANSTWMSIPTSRNSGQLFSIRVVAQTTGGVSNFSRPVIIRSHCGETKYLMPQQTKVLIYPAFSRGLYLPDVQCSWKFTTDDSLFFQIQIESLNIELSSGCLKDKLQIGSHRTLCGTIYAKEIIHHSNVVDLEFISDGDIEGIGFIASITSVGTVPDRPRNIRVAVSLYSILVTWDPPFFLAEFIKSYTLYIVHDHSPTPIKLDISKDKVQYVLDTASYPGSRFELWMVTNGVVGSSPETNHVFVYAHCGDNILLENVSTSLILMTPFSGKWRPAYAKCKWRILPSKFPEARVRIVDLQLPSMNSSTCSSVLLIIGNNKISCGHLLKRDYVIPTDNSEISFQISDNTYPVGVIISIETVGLHHQQNTSQNSDSSAPARTSAFSSCLYILLLLTVIK